MVATAGGVAGATRPAGAAASAGAGTGEGGTVGRMNRREFLGDALAKPLAGLAVLAAACGDDAGANVDASPPSCLTNGTIITISANHGHSLTVPIADIQAGVDVTYELQGGDHTHMVTITAANFGQLASNNAIQVRSTNDAAHSHPIAIGCR